MCSLFMFLVAILAFSLRVLLQRENRRALADAVGVASAVRETDSEEDAMLRTQERDGATERLMGPGVSKSPAAMEKTSRPRFVYIM